MNNRFLKFAFACVCLASLPALAEGETANTNPNTEIYFRKYDTNHDGLLTRQELKPRRDLLRVFEEADADHDGTLDLNEYATAEATAHQVKAQRFSEDSLITARIKAELSKDPTIKPLEVSVETYRGHVLLSGCVEDEEQVKQAERIASGVRGVVSVKNALIVRI
jgi:hyperosmotically inducible protein